MNKCEYCGREFETERGRGVHIGRSHSDETPWNDPERLVELYWGKGLSMAEMGERFGESQGVIAEAMNRHDIQRRDKQQAGIEHNREKPVHHRTSTFGYEVWEISEYGNTSTIRVHRLAAVAWFGWEAVVDNDVHHRVPIRWLNTEDNLVPLSPQDHRRRHQVAGRPEELIEFITEQPESVTSEQVADRFSIAVKTAREKLYSLHTDGEVRRERERVTDPYQYSLDEFARASKVIEA